ncbi:hypothetical protein K504DRAFT_225899 [Pleomassaria siparia CBS 279.74]|uniref:Secreted protein n=1 Tax=Pleomassaria siparia CBS 279.74 TaxID=1314801 RepID=A0A6G1KG64_9PLEO|nr:hypothetical protein K504DRAFT_225899 [Pleomassaria siparia CBS 279.74]
MNFAVKIKLLLAVVTLQSNVACRESPHQQHSFIEWPESREAMATWIPCPIILIKTRRSPVSVKGKVPRTDRVALSKYITHRHGHRSWRHARIHIYLLLLRHL